MFSKVFKIEFIWIEISIPKGSPIMSPIKLVKNPAVKKHSVIKEGDAPVALRIAISERRSITSITSACDILIDATIVMRKTMKRIKFFVVENE